jgi:2Fe-2S ferredoxin
MPKLTFVEPSGTIRVVEDANSKTLMEAARAGDVTGILAQCGGSCACGTCHVHIADEWLDKVGNPSVMEAELLLIATNHQANSRLACQVKLNPTLDGLLVYVPPGRPNA